MPSLFAYHYGMSIDLPHPFKLKECYLNPHLLRRVMECYLSTLLGIELDIFTLHPHFHLGGREEIHSQVMVGGVSKVT